MKKIRLENNVTIKGIKNFEGKEKRIDFYILIPKKQGLLYAFSKAYSSSIYDLCKSPMRINKLICMKSRNEKIMNLVQYTQLLLPYLVEEYGIPVVREERGKSA